MTRKYYKSYNKYMNKYMKGRYKKRRAQVIEKLGGCCAVCKTTEELQIDHIDRATKEYNVAHIFSANEEKFWNEISKCQLLCKKCHKEKTDRENVSLGIKKEHDHGTINMYITDKCRCDLCKKANKDYMQQYRKKLNTRYTDE
jgi:5-methylcytosine-specific restriction endonuclease McrA